MPRLLIDDDGSVVLDFSDLNELNVTLTYAVRPYDDDLSATELVDGAVAAYPLLTPAVLAIAPSTVPTFGEGDGPPVELPGFAMRVGAGLGYLTAAALSAETGRLLMCATFDRPVVSMSGADWNATGPLAQVMTHPLENGSLLTVAAMGIA